MTNNHTLERTDFAVVCALEVEREAICRAFQLKDRDRELRGQRRYWCGQLRVSKSVTFGVVVTQLPEMANVHAAVRTSKILQHWNPQALLLVGIAAAALRTQQLGDVIVGRSVYYYELGKATPERTIPQLDMIHADPVLLDAAVTARSWSGYVRVPRPDRAGTRPQRSFADIASGEKIVGDPSFRDEVIKSDRKIRAIEMEGYGFSIAALQAEDNIRHLVIRGLCDYADQSKGDEWHAYASASAAAYTRHLLRDWPFRSSYRRQKQQGSVSRLFSLRSPGSRSGTVGDLAPTITAVTELASLLQDVINGISGARNGRIAAVDPGTALTLPRYHLERAQEIVKTLRSGPSSWHDEGVWRFRYTDLVEATHEKIDTLTLVLNSLTRADQSATHGDPLALAEEIQANVLELQALLTSLV